MISGTDTATVVWRKSSRSGSGENCVEAGRVGGMVAIRDSKHPTGPNLAFTSSEWSRFIESVKANAFVA